MEAEEERESVNSVNSFISRQSVRSIMSAISTISVRIQHRLTVIKIHFGFNQDQRNIS